MPNGLRTFLIMGAMTVLLVLVGGAVGGRNAAMTAFVAAAAMNFFAYWRGDKMVLKRYRARELAPEDGSRLYAIVSDLAAKAALPMPKVYLIPDRTPNAFATGRNPRNAAVAATEGLVGMLDDDELAGVMAHELAHVKNRDILTGTIAATFAGAIATLSQMARYSSARGAAAPANDGRTRRANPLTGMLMIAGAPIAAMVLRMAVSRTREYAADDGGAEISGRPASLASALEKISNPGFLGKLQRLNPAHSDMFIVAPFAGGGLARLMSSHPPAAERIARLRAMAGHP